MGPWIKLDVFCHIVIEMFCGLTRLRLTSPQHFDHCYDASSLSIRVQITLNHISIYFLLQYQRQRKVFFFRARAENGIARHASSVVWTLIDNGKLANHIARLAAIVVKYSVYFAITISHVLLLS